jgi:glycosyltransferase involved in cell wall biosynthesis
MNNKRIIMIGPSENSKGGIASVVLGYKSAGLFDMFNIAYISTHVEAGKFRKLYVAVTSWLKLVGLLLTFRVALVHVHVARWNSFWRKSFFIFTAFVFNCPVIIHIHSGRFSDFYETDCGYIGKHFIKFIFNHSARIIVLTSAAYKWVSKIVNHERLHILHNFIEASDDNNVSYVKERGLLLFLGRLTKEKGVFDLLDAMPIVLRDFPSVHLVLAGEGEIEAVKAKISELQLSNHITLPGWVKNGKKTDLLSRSQIFILPSYEEGLSIGILEAMKTACAIVSTDVGGIPDQIENNVQGLLVSPGDIQSLGMAISRLLSDQEACTRMGAAGLETVNKRFSAGVVLPQLADIYKILGASKERA